MASKPSTDLANNLLKKFVAIEATRKRMEKLHLQGKIYKKDIDHVYEGIFLKVVTSFESYLETLFLGLLYRKYKFDTRKKVNRATFDSKMIATDIVLNGQAYTDWLPLEKLEKKAKIYFEEGYPFTKLTQTEKEYLKQIGAIRNAIAHKSPYSDHKFKKQVVDISTAIPDTNKTPAGFLRYVYRTGPSQTKFESYLFELISISRKIAEYN